MSVEQALIREKYERSDQSEYIDGLLLRQRLVNTNVVNFASKHIPTGGLVIDTCAGPEGSLLPATLHGFAWIGNDLSRRFAATLKASSAKNVVLSDFSHAPFRDDSADGVLMIFALNNIDRTVAPLSEAERVLKQRGTLVVADPGPSTWVVNILLSVASDVDSNIPMSVKAKDKVIEHFSHKNYSREDYVRFYVENKLGMGTDEFIHSLRDIDCVKARALEFEAGRMVKGRYFENLIAVAKENGMYLEDQGIMAMAKVDAKTDWLVSSVVSAEESSFINDYRDALKWHGRAADQIGENYKSASTRVVVPVLCFKKGSKSGLAE